MSKNADRWLLVALKKYHDLALGTSTRQKENIIKNNSVCIIGVYVSFKFCDFRLNIEIKNYRKSNEIDKLIVAVKKLQFRISFHSKTDNKVDNLQT